MSDNRRVYRHIMNGLKQTFPRQLSASEARLLNNLSGMVAGIVQGKQCHLESIARKTPDGNKVTSREKRYKRMLINERVNVKTFYMPFVIVILQTVANAGHVTLVMDGSVTGRGCMTLMMSVLYKGRAIPLVWVTVTGKKGHLPEKTHLELLALAIPLIPPDCTVVFLGDGEFDGDNLRDAIDQAGWRYVTRTAKNRLIDDAGDCFRLDEIGLQPGQCIDLLDVRVGGSGILCPLVIAWWRKGCDAPIYLLTNHDCIDEACDWYGKRYTIETFFSDQKSRGFNLHRTHLADPDRVNRLLIAAALAYFWVIYLGAIAVKENWIPIIHRTDRCDLGLFQLGLRLLDHLLNEALDLLFSLHLPDIKTVR